MQLHPLACTAFNADFDGDQMAVHLPLGNAAILEAQLLMLGSHNVLNPANGAPITVPSQDMVLGLYYITKPRKGVKGEGLTFYGPEEAIIAYNEKRADLHAQVKCMVSDVDENGNKVRVLKETTIGRILFNQVVPEEVGYINEVLTKRSLRDIIAVVMKKAGADKVAAFLDDIKAMGYQMAFQGGLSFNLDAVIIPEEKEKLVQEGYERADEVIESYNMGLITNNERYNQIIDIWTNINTKLTKTVIDTLIKDDDGFNPVYMMLDSGARGSKEQIRQLSGMRGLMAKPQKSGVEGGQQVIENPILSNFKEGLSVLEYFISTHGARKGLADTALKTADAGYLTRRLVDVAQDVIINEEDCGTLRGLTATAIKRNDDVVQTLYDRILGRTALNDVIHPLTGEVLCKAGEEITESIAEAIEKSPLESVEIRSVLTCESRRGVCAKCYGRNLATARMVQKGEVVGVIAAQSIGEPGTQLTMRTFHTGGVAGSDITQGLPRVEELFEARRPKKAATLAEIGGMVSIEESKRTTVKTVNVVDPKTGDMRSYQLASSSGIRVTDGQEIPKGFQLNEGSLNPHDILRILDPRAVHDYEIKEVQKVYRQQGVDINDKHIEVIVRQMLKKIRIEENGDTEFLPGDMVDFLDYDETNKALIAEGKEPAEGKQVLLGITKASLASDSFLSAASFQETTKVLTDAAIKGKVDHLVGLKENVIIGKPIPAGTGMKCYSNIHLNTDSMIEEEEDEDLILTEDLEDEIPAAEAPVEEPSAEEEEPMLDFDFEEMIPSKDDTEE